MDEQYCGFRNEKELHQVIEAWREIEKRVRQMQSEIAYCLDSKDLRVIYRALTYALRPVDELDSEAGMKALGVNLEEINDENYN